LSAKREILELMETSSILVTVVLVLAAIALLLYILRRR
jgi:hypothetical protein